MKQGKNPQAVNKDSFLEGTLDGVGRCWEGCFHCWFCTLVFFEFLTTKMNLFITYNINKKARSIFLM